MDDISIFRSHRITPVVSIPSYIKTRQTAKLGTR
jgi:hypothetical protein